MPVDVLDKKLCSGCGACFNICPKKCIQMQPDMCGFLYPVIDKTRCIGCGLCDKVCPIVNSSRWVELNPVSVNAAWSKDDDVRYSSTSGGIFSELANQVIMEGGSVAGAAYGEDGGVEHQVVQDVKGIERLRQSKYLQSDMKDIYRQIRTLLDKQTVLFCGTPCQVVALKQFLGEDTLNLLTIDFICRGVNSPKAYRSWIGELEQNYSAKVRRVWFKYKENGWKESPRCTRIDFDNGVKIVQNGKENVFMCGYLGPNLYIRPSCSTCKFKGDKRGSDITVGDFWGIKESMDDNKGTSFVQVNTGKGLQLINSIRKRIYIYECSSDDVRAGNRCMHESVVIHPKSEEFFCKLSGGGIPFSKLVYKYSKKSLTQRIRAVVGRAVRKIKKRIKYK